MMDRLEPGDRVLLGTGTLSWFKEERITDRYGTVILMPDGTNSLTPETTGKIPTVTVLPHWNIPDGYRFGTLVAEVLEARPSTHIGDLFRGIVPTTPAVGEKICLGEGRLFYKVEPSSYTRVGLSPLDGRNTDWLDPQQLYRAHEQTVNLWFVESNG